MTSSEVAVTRVPIGFGQRGVELRSVEDLFRFGKAICDSGLAPQAFKRPEQVIVAVQFGAELGLSPMQSLQSLSVIGNRPALMVRPALALVDNSGLMDGYAERFEGEGDKLACVIWMKRKGGREIERIFSVADAKQAKLWGKDGPWTQYPRRMLYNRAVGFALNDLFPDVLRGISIFEEMADVEQQETILPKRLASPTAGPDPLMSQIEAGASADAEIVTNGHADEAEPVERQGSLL